MNTRHIAAVLLLVVPFGSAVSDIDLKEIAANTRPDKLYAGNPAQKTGLDTPGDKIQAGFPVNYEGAVLAGVDELGRVLIATDYDGDGLADISYLATAPERLEGPWSWFIASADIKYNNARLRIRSKSHDYALRISHGDRGPIGLNREKYAEVFELLDAIETVVQVTYPSGTGSALSDMSHTNLEAWPDNFWYDALDPGTATPDCSCPECLNIPEPRTHMTCLLGDSDGECSLDPGECGTNPITGLPFPGCGPVQCTGGGGPVDTYFHVCCSCVIGPSCRCKECGTIGQE